MNDSMVDRLDDQEPVTITEALEIPQPRAVGSPLPRGIGSRVSVPPTYADLEDRLPVAHPGPVLAPPPSPFSFAGPVLATTPASAPVAEPTPQSLSVAHEPAPAPVQARCLLPQHRNPRPPLLQRPRRSVRVTCRRDRPSLRRCSVQQELFARQFRSCKNYCRCSMEISERQSQISFIRRRRHRPLQLQRSRPLHPVLI